MTRIDSYEDLTDNIVGWLKDYYWMHNVKAFVVGAVSYTHLTLPTIYSV